MADRLPTYSDLASLLDSLPFLMRETRRQRGLNLREAAAQIGVGHTTVARIERGEDFSSTTAVLVLRWFDVSRSGLNPGGED